MTLSLDDVRELAACVARPDFELLHKRQRAIGFCAHPVRLKGRIDVCDEHGRRRTWSTINEPDGVLRKRAGTGARPSAHPVPSATARTPTN